MITRNDCAMSPEKYYEPFLEIPEKSEEVAEEIEEYLFRHDTIPTPPPPDMEEGDIEAFDQVGFVSASESDISDISSAAS